MTVILESLHIESVDLEGQGLSHHEGKVIFVENALLGEQVDVEITRSKASYAKGRAIAWHRSSPQRVLPGCEFFGVCGGCAMQHIEPAAQLAIKQRVLEDNLWHLARLKPEYVLAPLDGPAWGYRTRARLTARWVEKKGGMLVGFHERKSSYVAVMNSCRVLHPRLSELLMPMRELLAELTIAKRIPQLEVALGETAVSDDISPSMARENSSIVWVIRILEPLTVRDEEKLRAFADRWHVQFWLQPGGPATASPFYPTESRLSYYLSEFSLEMPFSPVDFTQVNPAMNQVMVRRALGLLQAQATDRVADFFCGLGNFTLPAARFAQKVVGFEGSPSLTQRAMENARLHQLDDRVTFLNANLFDIDPQWLIAQGQFDRVLLDPPREGALALCQAYRSIACELGRADFLPKRIVYVSCNPATLARDAAILVHEGGWQLKASGVINMFVHTAHVESITVFERPQSPDNKKSP